MRSWRFNGQYKGASRVLTLGRYPDWASKAAHVWAREIRVSIDRNLDPWTVFAPRRQTRRIVAVLGPAARKAVLPAVAEAPLDTVALLFERYDREVASKRRPSHQVSIRQHFASHVLPCWGDRDVAFLVGQPGRREIADLVSAVRQSVQQKGKAGQDGIRTASLTQAIVKTWVRWLVSQGMLPDDSAVRDLRQEAQPERAVILKLPQLGLVWRACERLAPPIAGSCGY